MREHLLLQTEEALLPNCEQDEVIEESVWEMFTRLFADMGAALGEAFQPITHVFRPVNNQPQHSYHHFTVAMDFGVPNPQPIIVSTNMAKTLCKMKGLNLTWATYDDPFLYDLDDEPAPRASRGYCIPTDTDRERHPRTLACARRYVGSWVRLLLHTVWPRAP